MNVAVTLLCFAAAAMFHQALYVLIPILSVFHLSTGQKSILNLNQVLKTYLGIVLVSVLFFVLQSVLTQELKLFSLKGIARYTTYFLFAVMVFSFEVESIGRILRILILYLCITLIFGIYQTWDSGRYQNIFQHANHFAYVIDMCIYFMIFHKPFNRHLRNLVLIFLFISLLMTKSSGGMAVLLSILAYNLMISKKISFNKKFILFLSFISISVVAIASSEKLSGQLESISYLNWDFLKDRVANFRGGGYGSFIWRIIYWIKILFSFFAESAWQIIFGIGIDHLTSGNMPFSFMKKDPHNDFIKILVEFGLLGFVLFLGIFWKVYYVMNRNFNLVLLMLIPMFFGNVIVNFPFNLTFTVLIAYEYKRISAQTN